MRRPILIIFIAYILGILLKYYIPYSFPYSLGFGITFFLVFLLCDRHKRGKNPEALCCLFVLFLIIGMGRFQAVSEQVDSFAEKEGKLCSVTGRVSSVQQKDETYFQLIFKTVKRETILVKVIGKMNHGLASDWDLIGRNVALTGQIQLPSQARNPGGFDYKGYLRTKGIQTIMQVQGSQVTLVDAPVGSYFRVNLFQNRIFRLKQAYLEKLQAAMAPSAFGLFSGMLFGDKSVMDDGIYEMFQKNGVAHILSVSGIHVGILYLFLNHAFRNRRSFLFCGLSLGVLFSYAALSEFSPSVLRAVSMIGIHILSKQLHRRYDLLTCACFCGLSMTLFNPFLIFSLGFQLSYLAVFCLAVALPWMNRRIDLIAEADHDPRFVIALCYYLCPLFALQLGMIPFTAYCFYYFSPISLLLNIPIIALAGLVIPVGILLMPVAFLLELDIFAYFPGNLIFGVGVTGLELIIKGMIFINELFFHPGISYQNVVSPPLWFLLLYYLLLFFCLSESFRILWQRKRRKRIAGILAVFAFLSCTLSVGMQEPNGGGIYFLDVGQGDCLFLKTPKGKYVMIDGGGSLNYDVGKKTLLPFLLKHGIDHIDLVLVSHLHDDHFLGIVSLAKEIEIKKLGTYASNQYREEEILKKTGLSRENMLYLVKGQRIWVEDGVLIDVLYPQERTSDEYKKLLEEETDENLSSLLMKVSFLDMDILMTGDMGFEGEEAVMELYQQQENDPLHVDILKVGHHGSKYSTSDEFLRRVSPRLAVFQVGKNNFGHPSRTVIEKCEKLGIMVLRNDSNGAIMLQKGKEWHLKTMLPRSIPIKELQEN